LYLHHKYNKTLVGRIKNPKQIKIDMRSTMERVMQISSLRAPKDSNGIIKRNSDGERVVEVNC
jgi:hypothetical protein